uniref:Uncharacterized protein n=1 Tax=Avena sativa TaxID=4498 RepID=A0ACD5TZI0_AVESA
MIHPSSGVVGFQRQSSGTTPVTMHHWTVLHSRLSLVVSPIWVLCYNGMMQLSVRRIWTGLVIPCVCELSFNVPRTVSRRKQTATALSARLQLFDLDLVDQVVTDDASRPLPVVVYLHGGGFMFISASSWALDTVCRRFCHQLGVVLVSVNYRPAPEHRYPAAYDDCMDVLRYLGSTGPGGLPAHISVSVAVDLSRCFLIGDSAGGNIAHHVALEWTVSPGASPHSGNTVVRLADIMLLQPYFGGEERTEAELTLDGMVPIVNIRLSDWAWRSFLPEGADRNHPAAHVTGQAGPEPELGEAFPPTMVVVGRYDPLQDWPRRYASMMLRKGKAVSLVEFPGAIHAFYGFPDLPDTVRLMEKMKDFIRNTAYLQRPSNDQYPASPLDLIQQSLCYPFFFCEKS